MGSVEELNFADGFREPPQRRPGRGVLQRMLVGEVKLPADSTAPGAARRWVTSQLTATGLFPDGWQDGEKLSDVLICTSELVNASLIANSTTMALQLRVLGQTVLVSLRDDHAYTAESLDLRMHVQLFVLRIFDGMTDDWGIDPVPGGRTLWFELTVD